MLKILNLSDSVQTEDGIKHILKDVPLTIEHQVFGALEGVLR